MMSKWVGETEANVRTALQQMETKCPCVLQMDEIEKGFASVGYEGDSGASLRALCIRTAGFNPNRKAPG